MADEATPPRTYRKKAAAEVFAVDRRVWSYVCSLGDDAAAAYLVLASGTGHDQRTTWWSATAVETRAGMSWYAAKEAIDLLKSKGVLHEVARKGPRPGYKLSAPDEIPGLYIPAGDDDDDPALWNAPEAVEHRMPVQDTAPASSWLTSPSLYQDEPEPEPEPSRGNLIWLPNALVVGSGDATPPIKRLRRAQTPLALRLFIDLYASQYLPRHNGIEWGYPHGILSTFKAWPVGERGLFQVWGFTADSQQTWPGSRLLAPYGAGQGNAEADGVFWEAFNCLVRLRLVEMVPHLIANEVGPKTPHPDVIHPAPVDNGTAEERAITAAAEQAARAMVPPERWDFARQRGNVPIVPVPVEYERFQLIGIPRLAYRPQTDVTSNWLAKGTKKWAQKVLDFQVLEASVTAAPSSQALRKVSRKASRK